MRSDTVLANIRMKGFQSADSVSAISGCSLGPLIVCGLKPLPATEKARRDRATINIAPIVNPMSFEFIRDHENMGCSFKSVMNGKNLQRISSKVVSEIRAFSLFHRGYMKIILTRDKYEAYIGII